MAAALLGCSHPEPFAPAAPGGEGPAAPGMPARLTVWPDDETWPTWTPAGILHTWTTGRGDGDRCLGLLPPTGGQRTLEYCANYPGHADTTDYLEPGLLDAEGWLLYYNERSFAGFPGSARQELRRGRPGDRAEASTLVATFPIPGPDGRPIVGVSHLRLLADGQLAMVLEERLVFAVCLACPLDTLRGGRAVATLDPAAAPTLPAVLEGTANASSLDADPVTGDLYFTRIGEGMLLRLPASGGPVEEVARLDTLGVARDVAVGTDAIYLVAGGDVVVSVTSNGLMQEDAGGWIVRLDRATHAVTPVTPVDGPLYRRLDLSPDGTRLLAQRGGDLWIVETASP